MARRRGPKGKKKNVSFDFCSLKTTNKKKTYSLNTFLLLSFPSSWLLSCIILDLDSRRVISLDIISEMYLSFRKGAII